MSLCRLLRAVHHYRSEGCLLIISVNSLLPCSFIRPEVQRTRFLRREKKNKYIFTTLGALDRPFSYFFQPRNCAPQSERTYSCVLVEFSVSFGISLSEVSKLRHENLSLRRKSVSIAPNQERRTHEACYSVTTPESMMLTLAGACIHPPSHA
jgi:hypothetical protein